MSGFSNAISTTIAGIIAGEVIEGHVSNTDAFTTFENGLIVGRFAKYDTGSLDNLDASSTPTIAGIVGRSLTSEMETSTYTTSDNVAQLHNFGYIAVEVPTAITPVAFGAVYADNQTPADYGKATSTSTGNVAVTNAVFWRATNRANVWIVKLGSIL